MSLSSDLQIGDCNLITCAHVIAQYLEIGVLELWVRLLGASEDIKPIVDFVNGRMDLAILSLAQSPVTSVAPTALKFSKKKKIWNCGHAVCVGTVLCLRDNNTIILVHDHDIDLSLVPPLFVYNTMDKVSVCFVAVIG